MNTCLLETSDGHIYELLIFPCPMIRVLKGGGTQVNFIPPNDLATHQMQGWYVSSFEGDPPKTYIGNLTGVGPIQSCQNIIDHFKTKNQKLGSCTDPELETEFRRLEDASAPKQERQYMSPKDYERKYKDRAYDIDDVTDDLAEDFNHILRYLEKYAQSDKITPAIFRNAVKSLYEKISSINVRLSWPEHLYSDLAKYVYVRIVIPSFNIYWEDDDAYRNDVWDTRFKSRMPKTEDVDSTPSKSKKHIKSGRWAKDYVDNHNARSADIGRIFRASGHRHIGHILYTNNAQGTRHWEEERVKDRFSTWFFRIVRPPFELADEVVIRKPRANDRKEETAASYTSGFSKAVMDAMQFMGIIYIMDVFIKMSMEEKQKTLTRQYRQLSRIHHPDAGGTHDEFIRLQKNYEFLSGNFGGK